MDIARYGENPLFSQAVVHNGTVYLAGQVSAGRKDCPASEQTREILLKIDALLDSVGSHRGRLLSATIWLTNVDDYQAMNAVWTEWLGSAGKPTRATVCGVQLAAPEYTVEITAIAAL